MRLPATATTTSARGGCHVVARLRAARMCQDGEIAEDTADCYSGGSQESPLRSGFG